MGENKNRMSLMFIKESMIIDEISRTQDLIRSLKSGDLKVQFCIPRKWFDDILDKMESEAQNHLSQLADDLKDSYGSSKRQ